MSFRDLEDTYKPLGLTTFDEFEDNREEAIQMYAYAPDIRRRFLGDHALIAILFAVRNPVVKVDRRRRGRLKVRYYGDFVFFFPSCSPGFVLTPIPESRSAKKKK